MKKLLSFTLAVLMMFSLASCKRASDGDASADTSAVGVNGEAQTTKPQEENIIKIGVFEPQSGENAAGGKQEMLGVAYANKCSPTVSLGGKSVKIKLVYSDNESSPEKAPAVAKELVDKGVSAVIGSYGSGVSIAAAQVFAKAGVPVIGASCTSPTVTENGKTYYRICYIDPYQAKALACYVFGQLGIRKVFVLSCLGNDYDMGLSFFFKEAFEGLGGTVVTGSFVSGTSDFSPYLQKALQNECQAVFALVSLPYAKLIIEQSASLASSLTLIGGDSWDSNVTLKAAKSVNAKAYISSYYHEGVNEKLEGEIRYWLYADETARTNNGGDDSISASFAAGYDAYRVLLKAIKTAGSGDKTDILKALPKVTVKGACGTVRFGETRDAERSTAYMKTVGANGKWVTVDEQKF